ncbi:hypothetical protein JHK82_024869 [Glycine max]|nr:hypothetical protein JHK82_024869 [Glycine max]
MSIIPMQRSLGLALIASLYQLRLGCIHFFIPVFSSSMFMSRNISYSLQYMAAI